MTKRNLATLRRTKTGEIDKRHFNRGMYHRKLVRRDKIINGALYGGGAIIVGFAVIELVIKFFNKTS